MDPFDEFEFKPLTEGLGFHKKRKSLRDSVKEVQLEESAKPSLPASLPDEALDLMADRKKLSFEDIVTSLESTPLETSSPVTSSAVEFAAPLPRSVKKPEFQMSGMEIEMPVRSPFPTSENYRESYRPEPVKKTPLQDELASVGTRRGAADSPRGRLQKSPGSLSAAILDVVVVMALGLIFTTSLLMVTQVDLQTLAQSASSDWLTQISVAILLVAVMQIYFIISRAYFGRTLGEWTFDLQLGRDEEYRSENYPLRVIMRSLLVTCTGVIVLPVLSFVCRRDLAGMITGLNLYAQRN